MARYGADVPKIQYFNSVIQILNGPIIIQIKKMKLLMVQRFPD